MGIDFFINNPGATWQQFLNMVPKTPCENTKVLMANNEVKNVVQDLKNHTGSGEKGWKFNKTGAPTQTTENGDHSVNFGDPSLLTGGYHKHTTTGAKTFSATDISTLLEIARYNGVAKPTNVFMGVVIPVDMHYVIRFTASQGDLPAFGTFSPEQLKQWNKEQWKQYLDLLLDNSLTMNEKIEQIFFSTLKKMGLQNKVILQKIDSENKVFTISENTDGSTTPILCN